jgi:aspartyl protease family protein
MRNLMIFAAILVGLGTLMAQMADKMSPASATAAPRKASVETDAPAGGRTLSATPAATSRPMAGSTVSASTS